MTLTRMRLKPTPRGATDRVEDLAGQSDAVDLGRLPDGQPVAMMQKAPHPVAAVGDDVPVAPAHAAAVTRVSN
jgi:hypothetical protein